jgi:kynurenine formamidase
LKTKIAITRRNPQAAGAMGYQIEMLANLDQVPEHGALVIVAFPKPSQGSGFPALIAILP